MALESTILEISFGDTLQEIVEITKATQSLKEANVELEKVIAGDTAAMEEYGGSIEDARKELALSNAIIKDNARELVTLNKIIGANIKEIKAQEGSIESNRAKLKRLTEEYIKLGNPTKAQTERLKTLTEQLKRQEEAIGNTSRNVGNYKADIQSALGSVKLFGVEIGSVVGFLQEKDKELKIIKSSLGNAEIATGGLTTAFKGMRTALTSIGIGLAIQGIALLIENYDSLEKAIRGVSKAETERNQKTAREQLDARILRLLELEKIEREAADGGIAALKRQLKFAEEVGKSEEELSTLKRILKDKELEELRTQEKAITNLVGISRSERNKQLNQLSIAIKDKEAEIFADQKKAINVFTEATLQAAIDARKAALIELDKFLKEEVPKLIREAEQIAQSGNFELAIEIPIKGTIDVPELQGQAREVGNRLQNVLQDEQGSLFDALGVSELTEDKIGLALEGASTLATGLESIAQVQFDNQIRRIEDRRLAEIEAVEDSIGTEQQKAARIELINEKFNNEKIKQEKEFQRKQKGLQITQAIINGALAVTNALATVQPFIPLGVAAAALAGTATAIQIGVISAQKFAKGGEVPTDSGIDVGGKPHSQGGTTYVGADGNMFEVERGEKIFVMKRTASQFLDQYSNINQMFGGKSWNGGSTNYAAQGGSIGGGKKYVNMAFAPTFDGGFVSRESAANVANQLNLQEIFRNLPTPVVRVTEINQVQNLVEQSVSVSEL